MHLEDLTAVMHFGHLLVAEMLDALEAEELALAANSPHIVAAMPVAARIAASDQASSAKITAGAPFGSRVSNRRIFAAM